MPPRPKNPNRGLQPPTTARLPKLEGAAGALVLHGLIAVAALISFRHSFEIPQETHAVPVDLVTISDQTNVRAMAPPAPPPPKVDVPTPQIEQPPLPQFQEAEPAPDAPLPKFDIKPDEKPVPAPPKPDDQPKPKKPSTLDFDQLLNKTLAPARTPKNAKAGPRVIEGVGNQNMMTADIADALRSQIRQCWSLQVFPPNPNDAVVDFDVVFNRDGSVASAQSDALGSSNPYTRAAGLAARSAIARCAPYKLPQDRYNMWHEISPLHFDPRQMMGQ